VTDTTNPTIENGDTIYTGVSTVATGGNSILLANAEVRVPAPVFPDRLRLAAFVDIGQVYERQTELYSFSSMRVTPGVGVRITTPLGPVRVDVAYNGYDPESGPLLLQNDSVLVEYRPSYQRHRPTAILRRLQLQFAIGQAF
jgi:outer membrane protein insertion porin family